MFRGAAPGFALGLWPQLALSCLGPDASFPALCLERVCNLGTIAWVPSGAGIDLGARPNLPADLGGGHILDFLNSMVTLFIWIK